MTETPPVPPAAPAKPQPPAATMKPRQRALKPRQTRRPSGAPTWPTLLLAGREKTGKSYEIARASASPLVGGTYWVTWGELDPDEYGAVPGANFEMVPHDGTLEDLYDSLRWARAQPRLDPDRPNLIALDSGTRVWDTLRDAATAAAVARNSFDRNGEPAVGMDLWNRATARWAKILDELRLHDGPSIITARLDTTTVMDDKGKPTKQKTEKIKAQRNLTYDVDAIIEMPERGKATLSGVRSVRYQFLKPVDLEWFPDEGVEGMWRRLGLDEVETKPATYSDPVNNEVI